MRPAAGHSTRLKIGSINHTRKAEEFNVRLNDLATKLLSVRGGAYLNWLRLYDPEYPWRKAEFQKELNQCPNRLYYTSRGGLSNIAVRLVEAGVDIDAQWRWHSNALQAASSAGYDEIVKPLLGRSPNVNAQGGRYRNALQAVLTGSYNTIVEL
ncbi:hypothetical protein B0O99DRAFT_596583 [Bisporella sp. PMI_857]|nr:hypothetical protein B0O99DRAFT_596583 [Bisporella sp. PMI_857]